MSRVLFLACLAVTLGHAAPALDPVEYFRLRTEAQSLFASQEFEKAGDLYARILASTGDDGDLWARLGTCRYKLKQYAAASAAFQKALALSTNGEAWISYQIAQSSALAGRPADAISWLQRALAAGYERRVEISGDQAFTALRGNSAFQKICGAAPQPAANRTEALLYDLDFLAAEIKRLHYRYRREPLPAEFQRALDRLRERIPQLSDAEIIVETQKLLAQLGDGHSVAYFFFGKSALPQLPVQFYLFSDGLYIVHAAEAWKSLIGSRVARIGGSDPVEALKKLEPFVSRDNPMFVKAIGAVVYLATPAFLNAADIITNPAQVPLILVNRDGKEQTVTLAPVPPDRIAKALTPSELPDAGPVPRYLARESEAYWFEYLAESKTVYLQFNRVENDPKEPIPIFAQRLERFLDERKDCSLVVDIRHNFGGNAGLLAPLVRALIHVEDSHPRAKLFILQGRTTFSAAQIFAAQIEALTRAIFVGEPGSSPANFVGEDVPVQLPNSGLMLSISTRFHQGNPADPWIWIAPEIPVALSSTDYFANRDPALSAVLTIIRNAP